LSEALEILSPVVVNRRIGAGASEGNRRESSQNQITPFIPTGVFFPHLRSRSGDAGKKTDGGTDMFHLLWTALIGLIVGVIAKFIMPGKEPGGIFITMIIGIAGAFLGTFLGRAIGHYQPDQSAGFLMSLLGALILLGIYHLIRRARTA
jgi:uncharacterized membrane protein YeaQ/YmgE (transglycosylase-associated protein family)